MSAPLRAAAAVAMFLLAGAGAMAFAQDAGQSASATQGAGQSAALTLTVDQAVARALANQPLIQQAQAAVEAARARVGEANSAYYPFLNGTASYNRLSDESFPLGALLPPAAELSQFGITIPPSFAPLLNAPFSFAPVNSWDFKLGFNQVIFQFGRRGIQVKLAENGVSAAEIGVEQIRSSLAFQAAQGFYTVLFLKQQLAALDTQLANLQEHLDAVRVRTQTGAATRYDELSTEVRITALRSQRIDADNMLNKQAVGLKLLLGIEANAQLDLSGDFTPGAAASPDEQAQVASALSRRPEIRQAVEAERAAELNRRLSTMGAWPTISGHASVGYSNGILPDLNTPVLNWVAGVQVNVPIFQGFLVARQGEEADKKLLAARAEHDAGQAHHHDSGAAGHAGHRCRGQASGERPGAARAGERNAGRGQAAVRPGDADEPGVPRCAGIAGARAALEPAEPVPPGAESVLSGSGYRGALLVDGARGNGEVNRADLVCPARPFSASPVPARCAETSPGLDVRVKVFLAVVVGQLLPG